MYNVSIIFKNVWLYRDLARGKSAHSSYRYTDRFSVDSAVFSGRQATTSFRDEYSIIIASSIMVTCFIVCSFFFIWLSMHYKKIMSKAIK